MNSKERVRLALTRKSVPDRIPIQFDMCRQLIDHFADEMNLDPGYANSYYEDLTYRISANEIRTKLGSDVVVVGGTIAENFKPAKFDDNTTLNEFGMKMKPTDIYVEVVECPLKNASSEKDIEDYNFPDPYAPGRFKIAKKEIEKYLNNYFIIGDCEVSLFAFAWHLTGMTEYLTALALNEPWVEKLNDKVEYWTTHLALQLVRLGVDAIWFGEDLGTQLGPIISPQMWRQFFKPRWQRIVKLLKQENPNLIIIIHSDGAVSQFIRDFIEIGFDVYNPVQPNVAGSDPYELKKNYGGEIAFFGGLDQQELLPSGDLPRITEEIKKLCKVLGQNGGYMLAPAQILQADIKPNTLKHFISQSLNAGKYT